MASYNLDFDYLPMFTGTNYFWWQVKIELYNNCKGVDIWEIIKKGPIVTEKSEDWFTEDYKMISKNSKAINILYCGLTIEIYE